jgi:hypothetical protein
VQSRVLACPGTILRADRSNKLSRWWKMHFFQRPWFTLGVLVAIALFATVCALIVETAFGKTLATLLVGPAIAVLGVITFSFWRGRELHK